MAVLDGPQRVRGLAGSGKTVVLAMKAALTHLRYPDAIILYTFYTKNLYQHIQRLITRFYRQFDDRDPNWSNLRIMHAWGGGSNPVDDRHAKKYLGDLAEKIASFDIKSNNIHEDSFGIKNFHKDAHVTLSTAHTQSQRQRGICSLCNGR